LLFLDAANIFLLKNYDKLAINPREIEKTDDLSTQILVESTPNFLTVFLQWLKML